MINDSISLQLSLPLLIDPSFSELINSERISGLEVKTSSRLKRSWHLKVNRYTGQRFLTVPSYLDCAPVEIKIALINWAQLPIHSKKTELIQQKRFLEKQIQSFILSLDPSFYSNRLDISKLGQNTKGNRYDLKDIFDQINNSYFDNTIVASVRWGAQYSLTSYQTTKTAPTGERINLITIAGVYNHPDVPVFAIEAVMYHEMLHISVPPYKKNGRNVIHSPEFKNKERMFAFYDQWREWEKKCIRDLAKRSKKGKKLFRKRFLKI